MKKIIRLACIVFLLISLSISAQEFATDYVALLVPVTYDGSIWYMNDSLYQEVCDIESIKHDNNLLNSFPNSVSNVTVYQLTADGGLQFAGVGVSGKNEIYQVIYDFSQTQTINWTDEYGENRSVLIGVGVRMVAKVKTKKAGINLASPITLAANVNYVQGSLEVRVTGISSKKINELIPTTTDLSPSSISAALQSVASIKSHIYDKETIISPQYLAYSKKDKEVQKIPDNVINP